MIICLGLLIAVLGCLVWDLLPFIGDGVATRVIFAPDDSDFAQILFHFTTLPRIAIAFLCGAGLALAGAAIQTVLRNPLASPTTLGVGAGVEFSLTVFILLAPAALAGFRETVALAGGMAALAAVYVIAARRADATLWLILAGMMINLLLQAGSQIVLLFNDQYLQSVFMWGAGDLAQNGWDGVAFILPRVMAATFLILALSRPLDVLALGDETAGSLGARVTVLRLLLLGVAVFLTATITSTVGLVGFIGLAVPAGLRLAGVGRARHLMVASAITGGLALLLVDFLVRQWNLLGGDTLPTGAATALFGAPFMIFMLRHMRIMPTAGNDHGPSDMPAAHDTHGHTHPGQHNAPPATGQRPLPVKWVISLWRRSGGTARLTVFLCISLLAGIAFSLFAGMDGHGFSLLRSGPGFDEILANRIQRSMAAIICGAALAVSGTLIQRVGRNPLASPEITGVSSATALAMIVALVFFDFSDRADLMLIGAAGGVGALLVLLGLSRRYGHMPHYLLLNGLAMTAIMGAMVRIALTMAGTRTSLLISWLAGTTYFTRMDEVLVVAAITAILLIAAMLARRPLEIMSLGNDQAMSLGLGAQRFGFATMVLAAILAASATLLVGPLSFVGLMAPHLARIAGYRRAGGHLLGALLIGANVMMLAEWLARNMLYPHQLPTGLIAALLGTLYFLILATRRNTNT